MELLKGQQTLFHSDSLCNSMRKQVLFSQLVRRLWGSFPIIPTEFAPLLTLSNFIIELEHHYVCKCCLFSHTGIPEFP